MVIDVRLQMFMAARGCCGFCGGEDRCFSSRGCNEYADLSDDSTGSSGGLSESRQNEDGSFLFRVGEGAFSKEDMRDIRRASTRIKVGYNGSGAYLQSREEIIRD